MTTDPLQHLEALVSMDTRNPPRTIGTDHEAVVHVVRTLRGADFEVDVEDLGDGRLWIDARRGESPLVVNCHLDTVPLSDGWSGDPLTLHVKHGRARGLGACDVKGAAACMLAGAEQSDGPARVLFTTDEEAGQSQCVTHWLETRGTEVSCAIVSEPTNLLAVTAHRGLLTAQATFWRKSGHASGVALDRESAIADLVRWAHTLLADHEMVGEHLLNIGRIEGGVKPNMIADLAIARFGLRNQPGVDVEDLLRVIQSLMPDQTRSAITKSFEAPALQTHAAAVEWAETLGLEISAPVDFWTEAALFARADVPAFVYGPGDIRQAHAPDEHVPVADLHAATDFYTGVFNGVRMTKGIAHAVS